MSKTLGDTLKEARERKGLTQAVVAGVLNVSRSAVTQWESGTTNPTTSNLLALSKIYEQDFINGSSKFVDPIISSPLFQNKYPEVNVGVDDIALIETELMFTEDVIPDEYALCDFFMSEKIVNSVKRPPSLRGVQGAYCFYMATTRLEPRFFLGEIVYANTKIIPSRYDYVVVRLQVAENAACVGRFLRIDPVDGVVLLRHNPEEEVALERERVQQINRIYPWGELLRVDDR